MVATGEKMPGAFLLGTSALISMGSVSPAAARWWFRSRLAAGWRVPSALESCSIRLRLISPATSASFLLLAAVAPASVSCCRLRLRSSSSTTSSSVNALFLTSPSSEGISAYRLKCSRQSVQTSSLSGPAWCQSREVEA